MVSIIPCDLHVHPDYSIDAGSSIKEYCVKARQIGLQTIGFSTHYDVNPARGAKDAFMVVDGEKTRVSDYTLERYIKDCREAQNLFPDLKILIGLEIDYFPGIETEVKRLRSDFSFDYFIGSVHCLDGIAMTSKNVVGDYLSSHSISEMADQYFELLFNVADCGLFDVIGHADYYLLPGLRYYGDDILNIHNDRLDRIVRAAIRTLTGFEINTSYLRKGGGDFYPRIEFLKTAIELGAKINSVGSDSHHTSHLGANINKSLNIIREYGIVFKPFYEND
ncbi:MAG: histidinol-phosphatase HisJ family protein [candidate division Zixibacteria bacterium]|nr:histidinol-phosphatase HisJ family protein [candidate division Zixibacteria bacterium]